MMKLFLLQILAAVRVVRARENPSAMIRSTTTGVCVTLDGRELHAKQVRNLPFLLRE